MKHLVNARLVIETSLMHITVKEASAFMEHSSSLMYYVPVVKCLPPAIASSTEQKSRRTCRAVSYMLGFRNTKIFTHKVLSQIKAPHQ